ncbi:MAG TPA: N-acetylglucosamine-6-phosphate deacetylase [Acidobacteriaceae bacterium]|nr:N-acetylglucosamine-6-phosphate deacetylase [Acidobacteriaceae bacterium]
MTSTITARRLLRGNEIVEFPQITISDGRITSIDTRSAGGAGDTYPEATLVAAYINIHVHGAVGHDVMEGTPESLRTIGCALARHGVGGYYPTTVTSTTDETLRGLEGIAAVIEGAPEADAAVPLGIHLEGPFLSAAKRGAHTAALLVAPSVALFDRFWEAAHGKIRILTIAPELPAALELIEHASKLGVICSLGHSNATLEEAEAGFRAGGRSATHTFNAMRSLDHRDPGIAAYVLDQDALYAEIICDGIHVEPAMVRLFYKAKGPERTVLITDGMAATGMPDGKYKLGSLDVEVTNGRCTTAGSPGVLAGSVLTMDKAVQNFAAFTGVSMTTSTQMATRNPARLMGIQQRWGSLEVGREANFLALSAEGRIVQSFRAGRGLME